MFKQNTKKKRMTAIVLAAIVSCFITQTAQAEDWMSEENHFEFSVGFLGGMRSYGEGSFQMKQASTTDIAGIRTPFLGDLYRNTPVTGPRWESRAVIHHTRLTLAYQIPFPVLDLDENPMTLETSDGLHQVQAEGLFAQEVRFGLGGEIPAQRFAPFVDVIGDLHIVTTTLAVDGQPMRFNSMSFSMVARAGTRIQLAEHWFVEASGEVGIVGPNQYGGQLMVGGAIH